MNTIGTMRGFARLHECQGFEAFVVGPEAAGKQDDGRRLLEKEQLAREKYLNSTSLSSPRMNSFAMFSNGSRMFTPKLCSRPAPSWHARITPGPAPVMIM